LFLASNHRIAPDLDQDQDLDLDIDIDLNIDLDPDQDQNQDLDLDQYLDPDLDHFCLLPLIIILLQT
jgi:hypothetical protein